MVLLTLMAVVTIGIIRLRNLFAVVILGGIYSFLMASVLIVLDAVDVAMTEASVGAGISTVVMLGTLYLGRISEHSTEARRVPGALRIDAIIALFSGLILFIMTIVVVAFAVMRLRHPVELPPLTMALTAIGGVVVQVISIRLLLTGQKHNLRTRVAPWHFLAMFVGNLFIMIAAGFIWLTGWTPIDQILGLTLGLSLLWAAWATCNNALDILMGGALADSKALREALLSSGGSIGMPGAHSWTLPSTPDIPSAPVPPAPVHVTERSRRENAHTDLDEMLRLQCGFFFTSRNAG